jgi:radical SAM protein with 4Fe4S-binding SPASM domain
VDIGMDVIAISNGTKIDFKQTSSLKKLKGIQLSIDGPTGKINDKIRGKGVYRKVMGALDKLYCIGVTVALSMVLFDKYFDEYKLSMEPFLQKLKDKYGHSVKIHFATGILPGRNICRDELSLFYNYSLQNFVDGVCKKVYGHDWILHAYTDLFSLNFHTNCGYGNVVTIDPTGKVYPCDLPYYPVGDIRRDSISDVLLRLKNLNHQYSVDNLEPCSKCIVRYICGGACRVRSMYLYGSAHKIKCEERYVQELRHVLVEGYPFLYTIKKKEVKDGKTEGC